MIEKHEKKQNILIDKNLNINKNTFFNVIKILLVMVLFWLIIFLPFFLKKTQVINKPSPTPPLDIKNNDWLEFIEEFEENNKNNFKTGILDNILITNMSNENDYNISFNDIKLDNKTIYIKNWLYNVKVANTEQTRRNWLMFVRDLLDNQWMLFDFKGPKVWWIWMLNTYTSLDIIFINNENIVEIVKWAKPCVYDNGNGNYPNCEILWGNFPHNYVIELKSWEIDKLWIKVWDKIIIN